jgi:hypothetical protein
MSYYGLPCEVDRSHCFDGEGDSWEAFLSGIFRPNFAFETDSDFVSPGARAGVAPTAFAKWATTSAWLEVGLDPIPVLSATSMVLSTGHQVDTSRLGGAPVRLPSRFERRQSARDRT